MIDNEELAQGSHAMTSSQRLSRNACHVHLSKHTTLSTDGNATEWTPMGMYYYMPWTPQKNDTNDEDDEDDENDEKREGWLLSKITL